MKIQRNTRQRQVILKELCSSCAHPTAKGLYESVRKRLPRISLGTVYRNLELLTENGLIKKLEVGGAEARFDGDPEHHHHVRCVHCGRVEDAQEVPADMVLGEISTLNGFEIVGHRLDFIGTCPKCKGKRGRV